MASAFGGQLKRSYRLSHRPVDGHFSSRKRIEHQAVSKMEDNAGAAAGQDSFHLNLCQLCQDCAKAVCRRGLGGKLASVDI